MDKAAIVSDNAPSVRVYVFELMGLASFFVALLLRGLGHDVCFLKSVPVWKNWFWDGLLKVFDIRAIDFQKSRELDSGLGVDYLLHGKAILAEMDAHTKIEALCAGLFPFVENVGAKVEVMLLQHVQSDILPVQMMVAWASEHVSRHPGVKVCLIARKSLARQILLKKLSIPSILIPVWIIAIGVLFSELFRGVDRFFRRRPVRPSPEVALVGSAVSVNPADYPVIFFPHMGIAYGNLFEKNQFYSDNAGSPFYPGNILHVDLHGGLNLAKEGDSVPLSGRTPEMALPRLTRLRALSNAFRNLPFYLGHFWRVRKAVFTKSVRCNATVIFYLVVEHTRFLHYVVHCRQFRSARIALIGYENLFPRSLSLALESLHIRTIASQERFITTFMECYGFVVDTYLVPTVFVGEYLQNRQNAILKQFIPVGQVRSDTLYRFEREGGKAKNGAIEKLRPMVLVLDFHSVSDDNVNRLLPLNNQAANRQFYLQIARLAVDFPHCDFVVRGKNDYWLSIPSFEDIAEFFDILPNIRVSRDYSRFNVQYELAARADVVVARHTSLGDECLGAGKPVIFLDYYPNCIPYIDKIFDYEGMPVIARDYPSLKQLLAKSLENPQSCDTPEFQAFREKYYGPHDGRVRERIAAALEGIYASCESPERAATHYGSGGALMIQTQSHPVYPIF